MLSQTRTNPPDTKTAQKDLFAELRESAKQRSNLKQHVDTKDIKTAPRSNLPTQSIFDELLTKTKRTPSTTLNVLTKITAPTATPSKRESKWTITSDDTKRPESTVSLRTQAMLANSALSSSVLVQEKIQLKTKTCQTELAQLDKNLALANTSTLAPLAYLRLFLQYKINQMLLSSHLQTLGHTDAKIPLSAQQSDHQARAINRALTHVSTRDPDTFCKSIESISSLLSEKLIASSLVKKDNILSRENAIAAIDLCYEKTREAILKNNYVLPNPSEDGNYLLYLTDNLCRGIVGTEQNAKQHFIGMQHLNAIPESWHTVDHKDIDGYNDPKKTPCVIL